MNRFEKWRAFLKTDFSLLKDRKTGAATKEPAPPGEKAVKEGELLLDLPEVSAGVLKENNIYACMKNRRSLRAYKEEALTKEELSYLLWASQGENGKTATGKRLRTVPSAGMTHPFETYLLLRNVEGLEEGIYRYQVSDHALVLLEKVKGIAAKIDELTMAKTQPFLPYFAGKANVIFIWSAVFYRAEWKFDIQAHKKILIDVGHVCQNLYLASESIGAGTCAIGIYDQEKMDTFLHLDGEEEAVIYLAAVGKKP